MSGPSLRSALTRLRQQAVGGTPGTTSACGSGSTPAGVENQQPQGFANTGTTGTSGTIENVARPKFPPSTRAEAAALREILASVVPVVPSQERRGFDLEPPADAAVVPLVPPAVPEPPAWTDDLAWCARLGAAGDLHSRRIVLREWVDAAGGWHDAAAVYLPVALPAGLALATLKAHARGLRLDIRPDPDEPELTTWLRGAP